MNANDVLGGLVERADPLPWCVAWHAQRKPIARSESTDPHTDGKTFGIYAETMIPRFTDVDMELAVAAVNALPLLLEVVAKARAYETWLEPHGPVTESDRFCARKDGEALEAALARLDKGVRP